MTASSPPAVWWSVERGLIELVFDTLHDQQGEPMRELPADAVRLVPADNETSNVLDANEAMGAALIQIGMALGLPVPRTDATWGARDIVAEITRQTDDLARLRGIEQRAREVAEANTSSPTKNPVAIRAARWILGEES